MTKHKIYMGIKCIQSDQLKPPNNSSISLYRSLICISRHIIPKNGIQTHKNIESILMLGVQLYHHLMTLAYQNQSQSQ